MDNIGQQGETRRKTSQEEVAVAMSRLRLHIHCMV